MAGETIGETDCYVFVEASGEIDVESTGDTIEQVRDFMLRVIMGWRYEYPDKYDHNEAWGRVLETGKVMKAKLHISKEVS